jgi:archaellum component FlaC
MDTKDEVKRFKARIAALESKLDFFETEFINLNHMLQECGFPNGIETLKQTVQEVLSEEEDSLEGVRRLKKEEEDERV